MDIAFELKTTFVFVDFMDQQCNAHISGHVSGRLETSTSLTYGNLMDCYTTITVATDKFILLLFNRFEVETALRGLCVDVVTIYDGAGMTSPRLLNESCGDQSLHNLTSTSSDVTIHFSSDNTAVFRGFDVVYTAFSYGKCYNKFTTCSPQLITVIVNRYNIFSDKYFEFA